MEINSSLCCGIVTIIIHLLTFWAPSDINSSGSFSLPYLQLDRPSKLHYSPQRIENKDNQTKLKTFHQMKCLY